MIATLHTEDGTLGQVWLGEDGAAEMDEAVGPLVASVDTKGLTVEDGDAFIAALPDAFANTSRVWVTLEGDNLTAVQPGNVERVDRFATMTAACPPSERELREPFEGGMSVVAPMVEEYEEKHLGKLKNSTVRQPVALPQEWKPGMTAAGFDESKHKRNPKGSKGGGQFTSYLVTVDHGYEGEKQERFDTLPEAQAFAQGANSDPNVNATYIDAEGTDAKGFYTSEPVEVTTVDPSDNIATQAGITKERYNIEQRFIRGELSSSEAQHLTEKAWEAHMAAKKALLSSGYQSEQETRRDFLASLTAASLKEQESETQSEDNARYADELCPDCGEALQGDGMCASCGYGSMAAAAPKIQIGKPAVHKEGIGTAVTYTERNGKKVLTEEERKQLEHNKKRALQASLVAAGIAPVHPPREWFEAEEPDGPMPLTITADGQVMGHVATWGSCHTGFPGRCTQPPPSPSGYSYFHTGALELGDGSTIPVGRLTFNTGHASLTASRAQAAAHYDHTGKVGAFVRARDGKYGIWVTGATRSDLEEPEIQSLRASAPSGDWRRPAPGKPMEMVGLLSVNVAGFPVPRGEALVAGAEARDDEEILAMVAAGFEETVAMADAYYAKRLEVLALIAAGTLEESLMTPMERFMAGTPAAR